MFSNKIKFDGLYVCLALFLYNLCRTNSNTLYDITYKIIHIITCELYVSTTCLIVINVIALYVLLRNVKFEICIQGTVSYR